MGVPSTDNDHTRCTFRFGHVEMMVIMERVRIYIIS